MWNIFFKIDGSCVHLNDQFLLRGTPVYHLSAGSHGNLRAGEMGAGQVIGIPKVVGEWKTSLEPLAVPYMGGSISGLVGVASVLMEQNYVSLKGAEAGHKALNDYICSAIDSSILGFDPKRVDIHDIDGSIKGYFEAQVKEFTQRVGNMVGQAVSEAQSLVQNMFSLVKRDVVIGYRVWNFSNAEIEAAGGSLDFRERWAAKKYGDWEVAGSISVQYDPEENNAISGR